MVRDNLIRVEMKSIGENVAVARLLVSSFLVAYDLTMDVLDEVKIALSEAVSNSIIHGYNEDEDETVVLIIQIQQGQLILVVEDSGVGIDDVGQAMEPAYSTREERMGLGFVFMQTFMDEVEVHSEVGKGTRVVLRKALPAVGQTICEVV